MKNKIEPGVYEMPNAEYHATEALSCSKFKEFLRSPAHYKYVIDHPKESTKFMNVGTAIHTAILEPERFEKSIAIEPEVNKRTNAGKEEYASFLEANKDKTVITNKDLEKIQGMAESVKNCEAAVNLLNEGFAELSFFAKDPDFGFLWKARPDWLRKNGVIVDLKKCQDATPKGFQRHIINYKYHIQAALYMRILTWATGKNHEHFFFIAIEEEPPHGCSVWQLDFGTISSTNVEIDSARKSFAQCLAKNQWPGYSSEIQTTGLPPWAF